MPKAAPRATDGRASSLSLSAATDQIAKALAASKEADTEADRADAASEVDQQDTQDDAAEAAPAETQDTPDETDEGPESAAESDAQPDDAGESERFYQVKLPDGTLAEVPETELVKGYTRDADYRRKTTRIAEQRKALEAQQAVAAAREAEAADVIRQRDEYLRGLDALAELQKANEPAAPNWAKLLADDPTQYAVQRALYQQRQEERETIQREQDRVRALRDAESRKEQDRKLTAERDALLAKMPKWRDRAVWEAEGRKNLEYAKSLGWTEADFKSVTDHRVILMLNDARLHAEAQARFRARNGTGAAPPVNGRPPVQTATPGAPGSTRPPANAVDQAMRNLQKTGDKRDAAAAILAIQDRERAQRGRR